LTASYLFASLDRSNIGNAKVAGMTKNLGITDAQYQWLLTIFYVSYIIFQVGLLGYLFFRASRWMSACIMVWGCAAILQATAFNWTGIMAARFFIGASEACFGECHAS
jgi:MFS family permease